MLSPYGKGVWLPILLIALMIALTLGIVGQWLAVAVVLAALFALLSFFRDPDRPVPLQRNLMVSPADGRVTSVHQLEHFAPLGQGAVCVRIFLSVLNVHVNRSPVHGVVESITAKPGKHLNVLNPQSAEDNENLLMVLVHPGRRHPLAAVRQIAGLIARNIICAAKIGQILQRGQRYGMIRFGSTTELYIPHDLAPQVVVNVGDRVYGGLTVIAHITPLHEGAGSAASASEESGAAGEQGAPGESAEDSTSAAQTSSPDIDTAAATPPEFDPPPAAADNSAATAATAEPSPAPPPAAAQTPNQPPAATSPAEPSVSSATRRPRRLDDPAQLQLPLAGDSQP